MAEPLPVARSVVAPAVRSLRSAPVVRQSAPARVSPPAAPAVASAAPARAEPLADAAARSAADDAVTALSPITVHDEFGIGGTEPLPPAALAGHAAAAEPGATSATWRGPSSELFEADSPF
jgi:hypothetical protein